MSNLTKNAIADAAKELLSKKSISKITIKEITDACGLNRQTFYYHFDDIYDLLKYIFISDAIKYYKEQEISLDSTKAADITAVVFHFMREHRTVVLNSYDSEHRVQYQEMIKDLISPIINNKIEEYAKDKDISDDKKDFAYKFLYYIFSGFILQWVDEGLPDDSDIHLDYYLEVLDGSLAKLIDTLETK